MISHIELTSHFFFSLCMINVVMVVVIVVIARSSRREVAWLRGGRFETERAFEDALVSLLCEGVVLETLRWLLVCKRFRRYQRDGDRDRELLQFGD